MSLVFNQRHDHAVEIEEEHEQMETEFHKRLLGNVRNVSSLRLDCILPSCAHSAS